MRILPVLDLLGGRVVHAVAGRRGEYRPVRSGLCRGSAPLDVARAFRDRLGLDELYVADLDGITGSPGGRPCEPLLADGFRVWLDAGIRHGGEARDLPAGVALAAGLETLAGPAALAEALRHRPDLVLSIDLRDGGLLAGGPGWHPPTPRAVAARAVALGVRRLLVLDLARVGVGAGTGTAELCAALGADHPGVEVWAGGGVRGVGDLLALKEAGASAVLVASALHDGRLGRAELAGL
jgi:phosphoribosylformimino-5-aminoimidazole carboxamide ribotide isomerase